MRKYLKLSYLLSLVLIIIATGCSLNPITKPAVNQVTEENKIIETTAIKLVGQEGKTAMETLKTFRKVETKSYGEMGEFVETIDGLKPDTKHFWAFYVNGKSSTVGASQYKAHAGDVIEFKLEKIK